MIRRFFDKDAKWVLIIGPLAANRPGLSVNEQNIGRQKRKSVDLI